MEFVMGFFSEGGFWIIAVKALTTALLSASVGLMGTLIGRSISKNKDSKMYRYAKACVAAAEMKYPNEGKKMGPEKMAYVMDQMAIKFPKIKESTYFYNIAEAAVLELNRKMKEEAAIKEFEEKYGEKPLAVLEEDMTKDKEIKEEKEILNEIPDLEINEDVKVEDPQEEIPDPIPTIVEINPKKSSLSKLKSF